VRLPEIVEELASGWNGRCLDLTDPVDCEVLAEVRKRIPMLVITHDPAVIAHCDREVRLND